MLFTIKAEGLGNPLQFLALEDAIYKVSWKWQF